MNCQRNCTALSPISAAADAPARTKHYWGKILSETSVLPTPHIILKWSHTMVRTIASLGPRPYTEPPLRKFMCPPTPQTLSQNEILATYALHHLYQYCEDSYTTLDPDKLRSSITLNRPRTSDNTINRHNAASDVQRRGWQSLFDKERNEVYYE